MGRVKEYPTMHHFGLPFTLSQRHDWIILGNPLQNCIMGLLLTCPVTVCSLKKRNLLLKLHYVIHENSLILVLPLYWCNESLSLGCPTLQFQNVSKIFKCVDNAKNLCFGYTLYQYLFQTFFRKECLSKKFNVYSEEVMLSLVSVTHYHVICQCCINGEK